jgi:hypothetical protein
LSRSTSLTPVTKAFAEHLELAEAEWNISKLKALLKNDNNSRGVYLRQFGNIKAMLATGLAYNPSYNRAFDITASDSDEISNVVNWLLRHEVRFSIDLAPPLSNNDILRALASTSLTPVRFTDIVFAELDALDAKDAANHSLEIIETPGQFQEFAVVLSSAFGIPTELLANTAEFNQILYSDPSWKILLIRIDDKPAAIATLHLSNDVASITCMGTASEYQNMGLQKLIIRDCITLAENAQARIITSQVSVASISEGNTIKCGFKLAYTKIHWGIPETLADWA